MIELKDLLLKFNNLLLKQGLRQEVVRETISKAINLEIKPEDIKIKNGVIYLNIKPIYKNEILIKQDLILEELQKALGAKSPDSFR